MTHRIALSGSPESKGHGDARTAPTVVPSLPWLLSCFADEAADSLDGQMVAVLQGGMSWIDLRNVDGTNVVDLSLECARVVRSKLDRAGVRVNMLGR